MKGTRPLDHNENRNLGLGSGLNFRWWYIQGIKKVRVCLHVH